MKKIMVIMAMLAALLLLAVPVMADTDDSLGSGEQPPTEEPTTEPGGETEEPTEEPTTEPGGETEEPVVDDREETQDQEELADTGIDSVMLAGIGAGLLLAGGVALLVARRPGKAGR